MADAKDGGKGFMAGLTKQGEGMFGNVGKHGGKWVDAIKHGAGEMQFWKEGANKGVAFGRIAFVTAGGAMVLHGALSSKTSDGQDRSALVRLGEVVLGTGVAAGSLAIGKGA